MKTSKERYNIAVRTRHETATALNLMSQAVGEKEVIIEALDMLIEELEQILQMEEKI
jgi:hypothetical protein